MDGPLDPTLEVLWKRVLDGWDESVRHEAFLEACRQMNALPGAAARYRAIADADEPRSEDARKKLAAVAVLAMASLQVVREDRAPAPPRWLTVVVVLGTVALVCWVLRMVAR